MFKIKAQETGRSMVEMLGVLAVIGVLSIAGIAGYRYAMDKYIANDVLHESNIRGFDVSANFKGKRLPDVREIGGFAKYTGTGKPIAVYPNPEDFNWAEYADKCPTEERCQAFDVEVKNLNKRQCQMIMQSGWTLPDAYLVSTVTSGGSGEAEGEEVAPIAGVSSTRGIQKTASDADSGLCEDFGENEQGIAIRFRFVSAHADFDDEDYEYGDGGYDPDDGEGEGETGSGGSSGSGSETGGGTGGETGGEGTGGTETPPETPAPVECTGNTESDGSGGCRCKADYYPEGSCTTKCESPRSWLDGACKCASGNWNGTSCVTCGTNEQWNGSDCVCDSSSYKSGNSCVQCPVNSTVNANRDGCVCGASDSYWDGSSCTSCGTNQQVNSSKTGCECKANWHGMGCATYCDTSVASISGGTCVCNNATTYWNSINKTCESCGSNKEWNGSSCVCNEQSYPNGDSCIQCPSGSTPTSTGCSCSGTNTHWNGSSCITCDSNATFKDNGCVCNSGYYGNGTNCSVCARPRRTNASNTTCDCPSGTIWSGAETNLCEEADDDGNGGSGGTGLCDAGMIWNSALGECVSESCSGTAGCPQGYVCDITDSKCIKSWECSNPHSLDISETDCLSCANRVWSQAGKCAACPSNQIRQDTGLCGCPLDKPMSQNGECGCTSSVDCRDNVVGQCCEMGNNSCRICTEEDCDSSKGLILSSGKCVCLAGKVMRLDETTGEYRCQCPENTPPEADEETCECPSGYDNIDENGDGINECVQACPSDTGFTGLRNSETGNCLCDTSQGYKAESETNGGIKICVCDSSKDYYPSSSGGCKKCEQTTVEWCNKRNAAGEFDCAHIDPNNWYCGDIQKNGVADGYIAFYVWNPSTKSYCGAHSTLRKNADGSFYCYRCDSDLPLHMRTNRYGEGRANEGGFCACTGYWAWYNGVNGFRCYPRCEAGKYYYPGIDVGDGTSCSVCMNTQVVVNGQCNSEDLTNQYCAGSTTKHGNKFWWGLWKANTPESCRNGVNIAQDTTPGSVCDVRKGCVYESSTLAGCEFGTKITTTCSCSTGGSVGQYCCSASSYPTASGCVSCTDGTIPNASRTGCEECPANMIAKNGVCTRCDEGYYPNSTQVRCLACPAGTTTDAEGLACTVCVDAEKVFDNTTGTCLDPCTQTADCSESTDGMCCDSERKVCRKCIPDDCNTNKGFEYANEKCICSAQAPILQNGECVSCGSVDETKPYWDGVECVATCPTEKAYVADNVCVESCPMDKPYVDNASCVSECPIERPYLDGSVCVGTCPSDKFAGTDNVCIDVTTWCTQQMQNAGYSTTDFTVTDETITYNKDMTVSTTLDISKCNLIVNGTLTVNSGRTVNIKNVTVESSNKYGIYIDSRGTIVAQGNVMGTTTYTDKYADGIYINTYATIRAQGDVKGICITSAYGQGIHTMNASMIEADSVIGTSETGDGIWNGSGTIKANNVTGMCTGTNTGSATGAASGIYNSSGTIKANNVTGTSIIYYGVDNVNGGVIEANNVTGTSKNNKEGIYNAGSSAIKAANVYYCNKINNEGTIIGRISCLCAVEGLSCLTTEVLECEAPTPVSHNEVCYTCEQSYIHEPYWDANSGTCQSCIDVDERTPYYDSVTRTCTTCPSDKPYWSGTACESACPPEKPLYNDNNICSVCPTSTSYWDGINNQCVAICPNGKPAKGKICDADITSCSYKMSQAGHTTFTVTGNTIAYSGDMTVSTDLDISDCNLTVKGKLYVSSDKILKVNNVIAKDPWNSGIQNQGTIEAKGDVTGISRSYSGVSNQGTIEVLGDVTGSSILEVGIFNYNIIKANNVMGTSVNQNGVRNYEAIDAKGNITGGSINEIGIYVSGTIEAKGDVIGTSENKEGLYISTGTITATTITGQSTNGDGIDNYSTGTITATNVYYCKTISNRGKIIGNISCGCPSGTSCTSTVTQCTAPTPVLSGNLKTCASCETADSTKPYWTGFACVASCPTEKPSSDSNKICSACPPETPYWNELGGVCVERCDYYIDGNRCVDMCEGDKPYYKQDDNLNKICILPSECKFNLEHTKQCVERCDDGYFISADGKQCVIQCPMDQFITADGKQCVTECPIGQYIPVEGNMCVTECPTGQFIAANRNQCVTECGYDEYIENNQCTESCSSNKPVPDDTNQVCQSCEEIDSTKPVWDGTNGVCSTCEIVYPDTPIWDGTTCVALKEYCTAKMSGYDSANYVVSDDGVITYTGDMTIASDLDISDCDLKVNGTLTVNEGISATTKNVTVTSSGTYGLNLLGSMTVNGNLTCTGVQYGCYAVGTSTTPGTLKVTGNVKGTTTTTGAVATRGFFAGSDMTTVNIGGSLTGISSASTGTTNGIFINSPNVVINGAIKGTSNGTATAYGVYISGDAVVTAKSTVTGTINDTAKSPYSIYVRSGGNFTVSKDVIANHTMYVYGVCVIKNGSLTVNASAKGTNALYVSGTLETQTGSITANGTYTAIEVRGILKSATTITGTTSGSGYGVYMAGTTLSGTNITGTSTNIDGTGLLSSSGTISATGTVQGVGGQMGIGVSGKITANLVRAKSTGTSNPVAFLYYPTAYVKATTAIQYCSAKQKQGTASGETLSPSPTKNCNW